MRSKAPVFLALVAALLLAALAWLTLRCSDEGYSRLLLAKSAAAPGLDTSLLEDFCKEEFLLTYETEQRATAQAHHYRLPVTLIGTNSCYGQILGYRMLSGGFFSAAAWQAGNREAVLNAAAAFQLFGGYQVVGQTFKLEGATWLIIGVLDDGQEETPRIYVPASVTGGNVDSLLVLLDKDTINADYAKNALKQLGIYDSNYTIIDLAAAAAAFGQRLAVGLRAALILIILLLLRRCARELTSRLPFYREQLKQLYLRELLAANRPGLAKTALAALAFMAGLAALITLALQILATCLTWKDLLPAGHAWAMGGFADKLNWLHTWHSIGMILFFTLLVVLVLILVLYRRKSTHYS